MKLFLFVLLLFLTNCFFVNYSGPSPIEKGNMISSLSFGSPISRLKSDSVIKIYSFSYLDLMLSMRYGIDDLSDAGISFYPGGLFVDYKRAFFRYFVSDYNCIYVSGDMSLGYNYNKFNESNIPKYSIEPSIMLGTDNLFVGAMYGYGYFTNWSSFPIGKIGIFIGGNLGDNIGFMPHLIYYDKKNIYIGFALKWKISFFRY